MSTLFGTCSWNFDSWEGLVYSETRRRAAEYLTEYAEKYRTAEIDSWFYRIPAREDVEEYRDRVDSEFRFTGKVPRDLTRPEEDTFLAPELFESFLESIEPLLPRMDALMFEFGYLNKRKMPSLEAFIEKFETFIEAVPGGFPYAVETRNGNYLKPPYFEFLRRNGLIHVFSEKQYMPRIYELLPRIKPYLGESTVIRLLGGDRKAIEELTGGKWDRIVDPREDLPKIAEMIRDLSRTMRVTVNVNNHYEGSAPRTIERLRGLVEGPGAKE
ncbi:MAG: DUF72 domain-containing protein [Spirochaetia bacterium]